MNNNRIYRFGWRPVLFMGGDRELVLLTALFSGMIMEPVKKSL